jgi:gliding motility-associated-like protein
MPALVTTSSNGVKGTWTPAVIDNQASAVYTFTPDPGQCANKATLTVTVNPIPAVTVRADTAVFDGDPVPATDFIETPDADITWTNSNPAIGLPATGTGNVPLFKATNMGNEPVSGTITVTPSIGGCIGESKTYTITVKPLHKDVFVPNVFSPNGDGKNDMLYVYGNYISKLEMRVFNQWGEQVALINSPGQGWNGTQRGKPQPVGVYVYVLSAELTDGRSVKLKGSVTLIR